MHSQLIEKPLIIAILGKSAAGKDTLAQWLTNYFSSIGLFAHNMVSVTTRPKRAKEIHNKDYYFVTDEQFKKMINEKQLIEHTHFRGWRYGVPFKEVKNGYINIGVFNLEGLASLRRSKFDYIIIPIYLDEKLWTRLRRSRDREGKWKIEFFRRAIVDAVDFRSIKKHLKVFNGRYIYLKQSNGVWRQTREILYNLERWHIIQEDKTTKMMRLGNFV